MDTDEYGTLDDILLENIIRDKIVTINDIQVELCYICKKIICYKPLLSDQEISDVRPYSLNDDLSINSIANCSMCGRTCCHKDQNMCCICNKIHCTDCSGDDFRKCTKCCKKFCSSCSDLDFEDLCNECSY